MYAFVGYKYSASSLMTWKTRVSDTRTRDNNNMIGGHPALELSLPYPDTSPAIRPPPSSAPGSPSVLRRLPAGSTATGAAACAPSAAAAGCTAAGFTLTRARAASAGRRGGAGAGAAGFTGGSVLDGGRGPAAALAARRSAASRTACRHQNRLGWLAAAGV